MIGRENMIDRFSPRVNSFDSGLSNIPGIKSIAIIAMKDVAAILKITFSILSITFD